MGSTKSDTLKTGDQVFLKLEQNTTLEEMQSKLESLVTPNPGANWRELAAQLQEKMLSMPRFKPIGESLMGILSDSRLQPEMFKTQVLALAKTEQLKPLLQLGEDLSQMQNVSKEMDDLVHEIETATSKPQGEERDKLIAQVESKKDQFMARWSQMIFKADEWLARINSSGMSESSRREVQNLQLKAKNIGSGFELLKSISLEDLSPKLKTLGKRVDEYSNGCVKWLRSMASVITSGPKDLKDRNRQTDNFLKALTGVYKPVQRPLGERRETPEASVRVDAKDKPKIMPEPE